MLLAGSVRAPAHLPNLRLLPLPAASHNLRPCVAWHPLPFLTQQQLTHTPCPAANPQPLDRETLRCVARTSLRTKLAEPLADQLTDIVTDAVLAIRRPGQPIDLFMVSAAHPSVYGNSFGVGCKGTPQNGACHCARWRHGQCAAAGNGLVLDPTSPPHPR